jgi:hypothetical protein
MFALATPVGMRGSFEDFGIRINPLALGGSAVSFVTSPVHAPVRKLLKREVPTDGVEACAQAWSNKSVDDEESGDTADDAQKNN